MYGWIQEVHPEPGRVADVGAGTGIFGEGMTRRGWSVVGVDPDTDLLAFHPEPVLLGTAESLPLDEGSVDLVTVAQAWHWIDPAPASAEFRRVLTVDGAVVVVLNQLDVRLEWVLRLARIMHAGDVYRPAWRPHLEGFGPPTSAQFPFSTTVTVDDVVALASTRSYWLRSSERIRRRVEGNIRTFLAAEGRSLAADVGDHSGGDVFTLPYLCLGYLRPRLR
nr:class I SAM-dependent methyltransferase [Brevibacterium yomogidense]